MGILWFLSCFVKLYLHFLIVCKFELCFWANNTLMRKMLIRPFSARRFGCRSRLLSYEAVSTYSELGEQHTYAQNTSLLVFSEEIWMRKRASSVRSCILIQRARRKRLLMRQKVHCSFSARRFGCRSRLLPFEAVSTYSELSGKGYLCAKRFTARLLVFSEEIWMQKLASSVRSCIYIQQARRTTHLCAKYFTACFQRGDLDAEAGFFRPKLYSHTASWAEKAAYAPKIPMKN